MSGVTPLRSISLSDMEQRECAPIYMGLKHNCPLPRIWIAAHIFSNSCRSYGEPFSFRIHEIVDLMFLCWSVRMYDQTCVTIFPIGGMGRNAGDLICTCQKIHFGQSLFWYSKLILTQSALSMS